MKSTGSKSRKVRSAGSAAQTSAKLLNQLVSMKLDCMKEEKKKAMVSDDVLEKVALAQKFKEMTVALDGNKLMAAKVCPKFKMFLTFSKLDALESEVA